MTVHDQQNTKKGRRHQRTTHQFEDQIGHITLFVLQRVADGLPGLPGHPKRTGHVALSVIAEELGVPVGNLTHPRLSAHLKDLAATYGVETPQQATLAKALTVIETTYDQEPVPFRGRNPHLSAIRLATGVAVTVLKTADAQALLRALAKRNGTVSPKVDHQAEIEALEAYGARLRKAGLPLPAMPGRDGPGITVIARAIAISNDRFARPHLATALARLARELGVASTVTVASDAARFTAFVDAMIAARKPVPHGRKGIAYRTIGQQAGIVGHRIIHSHALQSQLTRWIHKVGVETTR
ncbi:hypothetical protein IP69_19710 [Bosea sp. AAP35]|uniref:hypothetical protein n=1 Tax=Bosea sp. AAP35 TaxID=1523417 RepID=UPI0006B93377|nr:hypothetical protein [Bosea sp. AAP35]KPF62813.1 hypothetical protein IP69_19710 [Bosea sp. AAP35]